MRCWKIRKKLLSKFYLNLVAWVALTLVACSPLWAREITDALNVKVTVSDHPQRIVTLAPSLGELVADLLGAQLNKIVGVSEYTDYPAGLKKVPSIGPYFQFNVEKTLSLKPDLVFATSDGNPKDKVLHLRELGIPVVTVNTGDFSEIQDSIRLVATALGVPNLGTQMALQLKTGIGRIRDKVRAGNKLKVMLQLGEEPLIVAGKKSFLNEALEMVGAVNIYADSEAHYPRPSLEDILHRNPDIIIVVALGDDLHVFEKMAKSWKQFNTLKATQDHRVHILRSDALLRPTLRILEGLSLLDQVIHGKK